MDFGDDARTPFSNYYTGATNRKAYIVVIKPILDETCAERICKRGDHSRTTR